MNISPSTMEAAILVEQNSPLIIDTVDIPEKLDVGQVLVKLHVSGICGSQLGEISGIKGPDRFLPHLMGHEGSATVLEIGPGVKTVSKGDFVVLHWRKGTGIQSDPPIYKWRGKRLNAGWVTTFNTHAVISENRCTAIPKEIDFDIAALFGCAVTTGFGVVENNAKIKFGESVVVYGSGGIGLNIIQAASLSSAWPIIAVDLIDSRLELARKFGATHLINSSKLDSEKEISDLLDGPGNLDVFIDNTGLPKFIELGYKLTHSKGRVILVGVPKKGSDISLHSLPLHFGKILLGSHGGDGSPEIDIPRYLNLYKQGLINFDGLISSRYRLSQVNDAIRSIKNGISSGRVMIDL